MEALGDGGADVGGFVLRGDVLPEFGRPGVDGLARELGSFHQAPAQPRGTCSHTDMVRSIDLQSKADSLDNINMTLARFWALYILENVF